MKSKLFLLASAFVLLCSCNQNMQDVKEALVEDPNSDIQYEFIPDDEYKYGYRLCLKHNDGTYYQFDDEASYDEIVRQLMYAKIITLEMMLNDFTKEQIEYVLQFVKYLPIQDEAVDPEIKELLDRVYYDNKDNEIYTPENGYGYRKYQYADGKEPVIGDGIYTLHIERAGEDYGRGGAILVY